MAKANGAATAPVKAAAKAPEAAAKTNREMPAAVGGGTEDDDIAAMLMSLSDEPSEMSDSLVPEGSTVMEMIVPPSVQEAAKDADKAKEKDKSENER